MLQFEPAIRMMEAPFSRIRETMEYANRLEREGREIIHLEIGEPDFNTPEHIIEAAKFALDQGKVHYPPVPGVYELRQEIVKKLEKDIDTDYQPSEILVTNGVTHAMFIAIMAYLNEGDEVLIPDPGYLAYMFTPKIAGAKVISYALKEENHYQLQVDEIRKMISEKTKMIVLISPHNPSGSVLKEETLIKLADVLGTTNILILSDEIYQGVTYNGEKHTSIVSVSGMRERTILLNGFSKYYAMTGWRLGYIAAPQYLIDPMLRLLFYSATSANSFVQWAAVDALRHDNGPSELMVNEFKKRRDYLVRELNQIPGLSCLSPDGAFYIFLNIKNTHLSSEAFSKYLIDKVGVATVPGTVFGSNGEGYVRLSYANSYENIVKAVSRIKEAILEITMA